MLSRLMSSSSGFL